MVHSLLRSDKNRGIVLEITQRFKSIFGRSPEVIAKAPEVEQQPAVEMSYKDFKATDAPVITFSRAFAAPGKPNPKCEAERRRGWQYVKCICENFEVFGETIELWQCRWPGDPHSFWQVPVNKPIYLPRFVAEHLASRKYHRFKMEDRNQYLVAQETMNGIGTSDVAQTMVARETHKRLGCRSAEFEF